MRRGCYPVLLWLHPPGFRREFAGEMLWIFDEAAGDLGCLALFADAIASLARQWVIGCGTWKVALAMVGGLLEMILAALLVTGLEPMQMPPHPHRAAPAVGTQVQMPNGK